VSNTITQTTTITEVKASSSEAINKLDSLMDLMMDDLDFGSTSEDESGVLATELSEKPNNRGVRGLLDENPYMDADEEDIKALQEVALIRATLQAEDGVVLNEVVMEEEVVEVFEEIIVEEETVMVEQVVEQKSLKEGQQEGNEKVESDKNAVASVAVVENRNVQSSTSSSEASGSLEKQNSGETGATGAAAVPPAVATM
jgi:hypothetical protein